VNLDACAVELVFEVSLGQADKSVGDIVSGLGEHGAYGAEQFNGEPSKARPALSRRHTRDGSHRTGEHHGATNIRGWQVRGARNCLHHQSLERALPQFAEDQSQEEFLLLARGAAEQITKPALAFGSGP
jgi:hypothetical protein